MMIKQDTREKMSPVDVVKRRGKCESVKIVEVRQKVMQNE